MRSGQRFFAPIFVIVALFLSPGLLLADVTGSINGVVHDPSQAVVKGAQVTVTNTQTNLSQHTVTADDALLPFSRVACRDLQGERCDSWISNNSTPPTSCSRWRKRRTSHWT